MSRLTAHQRLWLRDRIQARSAILREEIRAALHRSESAQASLPNHHAEVDDAAVADLETGIDLAAVERDAHELHALQDALRRLPEEDFGLCEACGAEIPFARLRVDPEATRCIACQADEERRQRRHPHATL